MPSFYGSCVVTLKLLFDESLHLLPDLPPGRSVDQNVKDEPDGSAAVTLQPLVMKRDDPNATFVRNIIPKDCDVEKPGYRQAGKFELTLDYRDLPIDPRTIRACGVEIHFGTVDAAAFGRGMVAPGGPRQSVITTANAAGEPNLETFVMAGSVDEWEAEHTDTGSEVRLTGRDWRALLLDTKVGSNPAESEHILDSLDCSQPVNQVIRQLLGFHPLAGQLVVGVDPAEWEGGVVPPALSREILPRHRLGARGQRRGGRGNTRGDSTQLTFWDLIVQLCFVAGAIPYMQGYDLLIRPTRSIFDQQKAGEQPTNPTPFADGQPRAYDAQTEMALDPVLRVRRMVYGRDIQRLHLRRKLGGQQRPYVVRCVSFDRSAEGRGEQRRLEARWPPEPTGAETERPPRTRVAPSGQASQTDIVTRAVPGIRDLGKLQDIARSIYNEVGRGEVGGTVETKNLSSFGGSNTDPDLLRLNPGDGIELLVDVRALARRAPLVSTFTDIQRYPFDEAVRVVTERLGGGPGDEQLARVLVATTRGQVAELLSFFRVANVKLSWSHGSGAAVSFDFQNYILAIFDEPRRSTKDEFPDKSAQRLDRVAANRRPRARTVR